jgi:capsular polysaccharide transport system ATP-binding protein
MPALNALTPRTRRRHAHHTKPPILVSLQRVTLRDDFGHLAFQNLSFRIRAGERWQVVADEQRTANGLLHCIAGLKQPAHGAVVVRSHVSWPLGRLTGLSALLSCAENVRFIAEVYGETGNVEHELDLIRQLCEFEDKFWERPFKQLPNPVKQRFKLALSLAFDFDLYLLDPTALAPLRRQGVWSEAWQAILEQRLRERAVIAIGGDRFGIADRCTHSLVFGQGQLLVKGRTMDCEEQIRGVLKLRADRRKRNQS